ncbi:metallophosphoesterase [Luteitalea sp.]|jgi:predicted MPP superfamily phosphohydrolase|uniref:metallophosphoesterase n=1 Tax=Luteitalea sp. TaxID=2004800 RepID=UPI0037C80298
MSAARATTRRFSRRTLLRTGTGIVAGLAVGEGAYGALYERHQLGVTRADLPCRTLPDALDGLRIGLITDTHHSGWTSLEFIAEAVALVREADPDLVVLGGDYVTHRNRRYLGDAAAPFAALRPREGLFAVLGNHDDTTEMPRILRRAGVTTLHDARTRLTVRGEPIDLVGLDYWTRDMPTLRRLLRGRAPFTVMLAHDPRRLREAAALDLPLVLSGHTHGGQIVMPVVSRLATNKYPVAQGLGRDRDTTLFVSRGVGTVAVPCRLNCPPEVALLTLRRRRDA